VAVFSLHLTAITATAVGGKGKRLTKNEVLLLNELLLLSVFPAKEAVRKSAIWLDRHRASFETAALRPPQDEDFLNASKDLPHAEERP
jgi:hypothetical protein